MISVLIASMGRESLAETLRSIAAARLPAGETLEIVIADDSADACVPALVAGLALPMPVRVLAVSAGNVSVARNACLDAAGGDWLIFVDDDETVEPGWLEGHLGAARDFAADAVFGPVFPRYPAGTPGWFRAANPLFQDWRWDEDGRPTHHGRTGNTLIRRSALGQLRFDPAFGRTGGEDHDFFLRFAAGGHRMVVTNRARVHEDVPAERATARYALGRARRTGQLYARLRLKGLGRAASAAFAAGAVAKFCIAALASFAVRPFDRALSFRLRLRSSTNAGKLRETAGARLMTAWT